MSHNNWNLSIREVLKSKYRTTNVSIDAYDLVERSFKYFADHVLDMLPPPKETKEEENDSTKVFHGTDTDFEAFHEEELTDDGTHTASGAEKIRLALENLLRQASCTQAINSEAFLRNLIDSLNKGCEALELKKRYKSAISICLVEKE